MNKPYICLIALATACLLAPAYVRAENKNAPDLRLNTIVIDAGHGGKDSGTISSDKKTYEKTITLKIAQKLSDKLKAGYPGMKVVMTRDKDVFVPLNTRAQKASDAGGQLFISVHVNASARSKNIHGFSAYILGPAKKSKYDSYEVNLEVCKRENSVIFLEEDYSTTYKGYDDSPESQIFLQLMQNAFREQSLAFAEKVSDHFDDGPFDKNWGVMQGNFAVLRQASMPAVLLEFGFMSNSDDLAILRSSDKLDKIVNRLYEALKEYKDEYDKSVSLDNTPAAQTTAPAAEVKDSKPAESGAQSEKAAGTEKPAANKDKPATEDKTAAKDKATESSQVLYGTQVLASSKLLKDNDKFFKGHKVTAVNTGTIYKYVLSASPDFDTAKKSYGELKKVFPDAFFVKVENSQTSRIKP